MKTIFFCLLLITGKTVSFFVWKHLTKGRNIVLIPTYVATSCPFAFYHHFKMFISRDTTVNTKKNVGLNQRLGKTKNGKTGC